LHKDNSFNPLNDRIARDIRNELAAVFVKHLGQEIEFDPTANLAAKLKTKYSDHVYQNYIKDRQLRFLTATKTITDQKITDNFYRALVLWDNELFFEVHEILELIWMKASGTNKLIIQAMIRAAGFYIHLATGNLKGANKMAGRAYEVLSKYHEEVPPFPGLNKLLQCLKSQEVVPPKLL